MSHCEEDAVSPGFHQLSITSKLYGIPDTIKHS